MPSDKPSFGEALIACASNKCVGRVSPDLVTEVVPVDSNYGIRCCADTPIQGFVQAGLDCPNLWVTSRDENDVCVRRTTYFKGLAVCEGYGARLCTVQENLKDCSRPAKCSLNDNKVWTSTQLNAGI